MISIYEIICKNRVSCGPLISEIEIEKKKIIIIKEFAEIRVPRGPLRKILRLSRLVNLECAQREFMHLSPFVNACA